MISNIIGILLALVVLAGAGVLSTEYLSREFGVLPPKETSSLAGSTHDTGSSLRSKTATSSITQKASGGTVAKMTPTVPISKVTALSPEKTSATKAISAPGPLRVAADASSGSLIVLQNVLTADEVFRHTNIARSGQGGLPSLSRNATLDRVATTKLLDMFNKQYFEHVSPTGVGPGDLAKAAGYGYVIVGENLALGPFPNEAELVDAWMNSPGHRANILNTHYREIGIAVGSGLYEGRRVWIAVQSFGMPVVACPSVEVQKKTQIDANYGSIAAMRERLDAKKAQIAATDPYDQNYNTYVDEFNAMVGPYNALVEVNRRLIGDYNASVQAFNACAQEAT